MIRWLKSVWLWLKSVWLKIRQGKRDKSEGASRIDMDVEIKEMACGCYGYGRWDAPYWFLGPEQGNSRDEDIHRRVKAWCELGRTELNDCREFHEHKHIRDTRWHGEKPKLQKTWKQLMLFLMAFHGKLLDLRNPKDKAILCIYQRDKWGRLDGETCVIELSGLPAHSYTASKKQKLDLFEPGQFDRIRERRIDVIRQRMREQICANKLKLVVMYGLKEKAHWERIAEVADEFPPGTRPILAFPTHPVSFEGVENEYWLRLGKSLSARGEFPTAP